MDPVTASLLIGGGSQILGALTGGKRKTEAAIPEDLKPMRQQQIGLLNFLLGMGRDPRMALPDDGRTWQQRIPGYEKMPAKARAKMRTQWNANLGQQADQQAMLGARSGAMMAAQPQQASPQFLPGLPGGPLVRMMAGGGMVSGPGGPTDDMVPALLSNGEGVLNTDAVDAMGGPQTIHLLNALGRAQRMANGGIAGQKPTPTLPGAGALPGAGPLPGAGAAPSGGGVGGLPVSKAPEMQPMGGQAVGMPQGGMGGQLTGRMDSLQRVQPGMLQFAPPPQAMGGQLGQGMPGFGVTQPTNVQQAMDQLRGYSGTLGQMPADFTMPQLQPPPQGGQQGGGFQPNINLSGMGGMGGGQAGQQGGGMMTPQQRLESFFGPLGIRPSNLQQAATAGFMGQLTNVSPEQRAAEITLPQLQQNLGGSPFTQQAMNRMMGLQAGAGADVEGRLGQLGQGPMTGSSQLDAVLSQLGMGGQAGQGRGLSALERLAAANEAFKPGSTLGTAELQRMAGAGGGIDFQGSGAGMGQLGALAGQNTGEAVMAALDPAFRRNLAMANQQGGRFGTANAALRARALEDFNLQSARALQEGAGQQITAASNLGQIGNAQDALRLNALTSGQGNRLAAAQELGRMGSEQNRLQLDALLGQRQNELGAASALGNVGTAQDQLAMQRQLEALGLSQRGQQTNIDAQLRALSQLGNFRQNEAQTMGNIFQGAGQLGIQQGQMGNQAAQTIANILGQQGSSNLANLQAAFGAGMTNTGIENAGQQQALQILLQQLGIAQGATLGGPVTQTPGLGEQIAQGGMGLAQLLASMPSSRRT